MAPAEYLTIPFQEGKVPFLSRSPEEAQVPKNAPVDVALGLLGIVSVPVGRFCVLVAAVKEVGWVGKERVYVVSKVRMVGLGVGDADTNSGGVVGGIVKVLESGGLYYTVDGDLTRAMGRTGKGRGFWWTCKMVQALGEQAAGWGTRCIYGYVGSFEMRLRCGRDVIMTLVSRRSRRRMGTRYITRGVDGRGDVANFVETEQLVWERGHPVVSSFIVVRGSVPVFWRQINGIARPIPEMDSGLRESRMAFRRHFARLTEMYDAVCAVSLVDKGGSEGVLAEAFDKFMELEGRPSVRLVAFDFHRFCAGKEYERGLGLLMEKLEENLKTYGMYIGGGGHQQVRQGGVFRVNCVDCLDRTNVVQSMIARRALDMQLEAVLGSEAMAGGRGGLYADNEDGFKRVWGDNADAVSKQYSGTGALKTDFTRTGKRSTTGLIGDGVKSVMRMYYKNFVDEGRQEVIDVLCGNAVIRRPSRAIEGEREIIGGSKVGIDGWGDGLKEQVAGLWYSFDTLRINGGGDKQTVFVELHDRLMFVITAEGIAVEYPRRALVSWSKDDDGKSPSERKGAARLRLWYSPMKDFPGTASPLDLQFKSGPTARENFLRAVVSWSKPETVSLLRKRDVCVKVLGARNAGEHRMADWGLPGRYGFESADYDEVVALIIPEVTAVNRSLGLAAVPSDVDDSGFELVGACSASDRGPAIAVLVSKRVAMTVMNSQEAASRRGGVFTAGGAVGISLQVCGTSLCFVSANLNTQWEIFQTLSSMKLGRPGFDVTNQFDHFVMAGLLGDVRWHRDGTPHSGPNGRKWVQLGDGSACYSIADGISVMRTSFPVLRYEDRIRADSFWSVQSTPESLGTSSCYMALADGIIDGRPGPRLPRSISQCSIVLTNLRGEDLKRPPGPDHSSPLNWQLVLYSEYSAVDAVSSKPTTRSTSSPEWSDVLQIPMMPLDVDEVYDSFIIGQVLMTLALGEDVVAAQFVVPIQFARDGRAEFQVACRLAGMTVGRLSGSIKVETAEKAGLSNDVSGMGMGSSSRSMKTNGASAPYSNQYEFSMANSSIGADDLIAGHGGKPGLRGSGKLPKTSVEVNERLDAARRKGSKQIKSVVSKLSSLLNQPSGTGSSLSGSARMGVGTFRGDYSHSSRNVRGEVEDEWAGEFREVVEPADTNEFGKNEGAWPFESSPTTTEKRNASRKRTDELEVFGNIQGVASGSVGRPRSGVPKYAMSTSDDPLLKGLQEEKKKNTGNGIEIVDEDWGEFESASMGDEQKSGQKHLLDL